MMHRSFTIGMAAAFVLTAIPARAQAPRQVPAAALVVGSTAPNFSLPGATRYGLLQRPFTLSDYRGQTVVLAFFYQARTKG